MTEGSSKTLFSDVYYYVSGSLSSEVHMLLNEGGSKRKNYLSDLVTYCIVGDNFNENEISEAKDLYDIPVVTQKWVVLSHRCNKLLPTTGFLAEPDQLFSDVVGCISQLSRSDAKRVWAMITYFGGICSLKFCTGCTHLIVGKSEGEKYFQALKLEGKVNIVTPDWVLESVQKKEKQKEELYHPRLIILNIESLVHNSVNTESQVIEDSISNNFSKDILSENNEKNQQSVSLLNKIDDLADAVPNIEKQEVDDLGHQDLSSNQLLMVCQKQKEPQYCKIPVQDSSYLLNSQHNFISSNHLIKETSEKLQSNVLKAPESTIITLKQESKLLPSQQQSGVQCWLMPHKGETNSSSTWQHQRMPLSSLLHQKIQPSTVQINQKLPFQQNLNSNAQVNTSELSKNTLVLQQRPQVTLQHHLQQMDPQQRMQYIQHMKEKEQQRQQLMLQKQIISNWCNKDNTQVTPKDASSYWQQQFVNSDCIQSSGFDQIQQVNLQHSFPLCETSPKVAQQSLPQKRLKLIQHMNALSHQQGHAVSQPLQSFQHKQIHDIQSDQYSHDFLIDKTSINKQQQQEQLQKQKQLILQHQQLQQQVPLFKHQQLRPHVLQQQHKSFNCSGSQQQSNVISHGSSNLVHPKTKTALANLLNTRLQGINVGSKDGEGGRLHGRGERIAETGISNALQVNQFPGNYTVNKPDITSTPKPQVVSVAPSKQVNYRIGTPVPSILQPRTTRLQFFGHDPNLRVPPDLCLLGCFFYIVDYEELEGKETVSQWKQIICQHGGDTESTYNNRVTHVLCDTLQNNLVQQALREGKRCVTAFWLSDILICKYLKPPWLALHLPTTFSEKKPCKNMIISVTGFEAEERKLVRFMISRVGAQYTSYFSSSNTLLICRHPEGQKYYKAKEWRKPTVNLRWLNEILLGLCSGLTSPYNSKYTQFDQEDPFRFDYLLVSHFLNPWKIPIQLTSTVLTKFQAHVIKRKQTPDVTPHKPKIQCTTDNIKHFKFHLQKSPLTCDTKPRLLFSGTKKLDILKKAAEMGAYIVSNPRDATHLVMSHGCRTVNFLCALSCCQYIVNTQWVSDSFQKGSWEDEEKYILSDSEFENKFDFKLKATLMYPKRNELFKGKEFYVTPGVIPQKHSLEQIIECAGGHVLLKRHSVKHIKEYYSSTIPSYIIITCENDLHLVTDAINANLPVYSAEFVLLAVMRQQIEYDLSMYLPETC